jgi:hypothetical protein
MPVPPEPFAAPEQVLAWAFHQRKNIAHGSSSIETFMYNIQVDPQPEAGILQSPAWNHPLLFNDRNAKKQQRVEKH